MSEPYPLPPLKSPQPPRPSDTPSGIHRIVRRAVWWQRVQWGVVILVGGAMCGLLAWNLDALKDAAIGSANAQATSKAADNRAAAVERRAEVDAGATAAKLERLERKIDEQSALTDKKLERMQGTLELLVREVKKL
jgi:uncharacterized protein YlxW (UPF0749 family)